MKARPDLAQRVARGAFWASVESWTQQLLQLLIFIMLARMLGPEAYGLVGAALILTMIGEALVNEAGWAEALIQRREIDQRHRDSVLWVLLAVTGLLVVAAWLLRDLAAAALGTPEVADILPWLALSLPLSALGVVPRALLGRELRFRPLALRSITAMAVAGAVAIAMAREGFGLWSLVAYQVVQPLIEAVVLWSTAGWRPRLHVSRAALTELLAFVGGVFGERVLILVDGLLPRILVTMLLGPVALGFYTFARKIFEMVGRLLIGPLSRVAMPTFSELQHDRGRTQRVLTLGVQLTSLVAMPAFLGLALTADELVPLVFGPAWVDAVPAVQLFAALGFAAPLTRLNSALMLGLGKSREQFMLAVVGTVLLAALMVGLLAVSRTVEAVVLAIGARYWLMLPLRLYWLAHHARIAIGPTLRGILPVLASAAVMVATVLVLRGQLPDDWPLAARLGASAFGGGASYLAAMLVLGRPLLLRAGALARMYGSAAAGTADARPAEAGAAEPAHVRPVRETT